MFRNDAVKNELESRVNIGNPVIIRVFRGFDVLSSISGSKIMPKMPQNNLKNIC